MYNTLSKNYMMAKILHIGSVLIAAVLLAGMLMLSLSTRTHASPTQQDFVNTKQITGQVTWADGSPAEGIRVEAIGESYGWHDAYSNAEGYYTFTLPADTWVITIDNIVQYDLTEEDFEMQSWYAVMIMYDQWHGVGLPHTVQFANDNSSETHMFDISLKNVNSLITGTLRSTDGTPITGISPNSIYLEADSPDYDESSILEYIDLATGVYTVAVSSGTWNISYGLLDSSGPDGYKDGIAEPISVTVGDDTVVQQDLIIEEYDATISGLILRTDTGEPVLGASVSLFNAANPDDYRYADVGEDGRFRVAVRSGTMWDFNTWWGQNSGPVIYPVSWEGVVEVAAAGEMELTIGGIVEMDKAAFLPMVIR